MLRFRGGSVSTLALETLRSTLEQDEAFRSRVAEQATEDAVGRAGWVFLHRPDGWQDELDLLVAERSDRAERDRTRADERSSARRVAQLERAVEDLRNRVGEAEATAAAAASELDAERSGRQAAERVGRDAERRLERAERERSGAVADLASARRLADERLAQLRDAERRAVDLERERSRWTLPVDDALAQAREGVAALDAALAEASEHLGRAGRAGAATADEPERPPGRGGGAPRRRAPVRLVRGAVDGTVEGTDQLLRAPGAQVVVDGYNVSMEGWPHLDARTQRERLLALLTGAAARSGAEVHVVFDGDDDGRRPAVTAPLAVRVHYTPAEVEADDVVISMARDLPVGRPVVVVSSDHRVRDGARSSGANVVSSAALLAWDRR